MARVFFILLMVSFSQLTFAADVNCNKASRAQEKAICNEPALRSLNFKLGQLFSLSAEISQSKSKLRQDQQEWITRLYADCHNSDCWERMYQKRILELTGFLQLQSDAFPSKLSGFGQYAGNNHSFYCEESESPHFTEDFTIEIQIAEGEIKGNINGAYDCGRKLWNSKISGTVKGKLAYIDYDAGFFEPEILQALIVTSKRKIYWRALNEGLKESYIPQSERVQADRKFKRNMNENTK